jgi:hypothetical protein
MNDIQVRSTGGIILRGKKKPEKIKVKTFIMLEQMIQKVTTWLQAVNKTLLVAHLAVGIAL